MANPSAEVKLGGIDIPSNHKSIALQFANIIADGNEKDPDNNTALKNKFAVFATDFGLPGGMTPEQVLVLSRAKDPNPKAHACLEAFRKITYAGVKQKAEEEKGSVRCAKFLRKLEVCDLQTLNNELPDCVKNTGLAWGMVRLGLCQEDPRLIDIYKDILIARVEAAKGADNKILAKALFEQALKLVAADNNHAFSPQQVAILSPTVNELTAEAFALRDAIASPAPPVVPRQRLSMNAPPAPPIGPPRPPGPPLTPPPQPSTPTGLEAAIAAMTAAANRMATAGAAGPATPETATVKATEEDYKEALNQAMDQALLRQDPYDKSTAYQIAGQFSDRPLWTVVNEFDKQTKDSVLVSILGRLWSGNANQKAQADILNLMFSKPAEGTSSLKKAEMGVFSATNSEVNRLLQQEGVKDALYLIFNKVFTIEKRDGYDKVVVKKPLTDASGKEIPGTGGVAYLRDKLSNYESIYEDLRTRHGWKSKVLAKKAVAIADGFLFAGNIAESAGFDRLWKTARDGGTKQEWGKAVPVIDDSSDFVSGDLREMFHPPLPLSGKVVNVTGGMSNPFGSIGNWLREAQAAQVGLRKLNILKTNRQESAIHQHIQYTGFETGERIPPLKPVVPDTLGLSFFEYAFVKTPTGIKSLAEVIQQGGDNLRNLDFTSNVGTIDIDKNEIKTTGPSGNLWEGYYKTLAESKHLFFCLKGKVPLDMADGRDNVSGSRVDWSNKVTKALGVLDNHPMFRSITRGEGRKNFVAWLIRGSHKHGMVAGTTAAHLEVDNSKPGADGIIHFDLYDLLRVGNYQLLRQSGTSDRDPAAVNQAKKYAQELTHDDFMMPAYSLATTLRLSTGEIGFAVANRKRRQRI